MGFRNVDREDDVTDDPHLAQSRDTGGAGAGAGDAGSTTGTATSEEFVGRSPGRTTVHNI